MIPTITLRAAPLRCWQLLVTATSSNVVYVPVTWASGSATASGTYMSVVVPSPYRQDDTRTDITGMVISGSSAQGAYVYRTAISVASGWGDGRVASGVYAPSGQIISFGRNTGTATAATGVAASGVGESVVQANILASQGASNGAAGIYFSGTVQAFGTDPILTATGAAGVTNTNVSFKATASTLLVCLPRAPLTILQLPVVSTSLMLMSRLAVLATWLSKCATSVLMTLPATRILTLISPAALLPD
jgi:hypothetical protein